jgi:hypothetical protein
VMKFIEHLEGVLDAEEEQQLIRLIEKMRARSSRLRTALCAWLDTRHSTLDSRSPGTGPKKGRSNRLRNRPAIPVP